MLDVFRKVMQTDGKIMMRIHYASLFFPLFGSYLLWALYGGRGLYGGKMSLLNVVMLYFLTVPIILFVIHRYAKIRLARSERKSLALLGGSCIAILAAFVVVEKRMGLPFTGTWLDTLLALFGMSIVVSLNTSYLVLFEKFKAGKNDDCSTGQQEG